MSKKYDYAKSFPQIIVLAGFVLAFLFINAAAQEKPFTDEELANLKQTAYKKLENLKYRSTRTYESFVSKDSSLNYFSKTISKIVPPNNRHTITETKDSRGLRKEESIFVNGRLFLKYDDGDWKEIIEEGNGSGYGMGRGRGSGSGGESNVKITRTENYKLEKDQIVNDQKADLYEKTITIRYTSDDFDYSKTNSEKYWFNKDGLFVRTETENTSTYSESFTRSTALYEYDPNIKIEVPIVGKEEKP
jgi:hypothetical protein